MMHCFVTPWTAVVTFSARPAAAGLRCTPPLLLARRPQGRSRNFTTARPQRELLRSPGGVPEIARVFPEQYESLLNEKVELLESLLADAVTHHDEDESLPPIEVFRSPSINFRMRASFQVWRDGVDPDATRHFVMYNRDDKVMPREVLSYPMGSLRINALMAPTLEAISASEVLQRKVRQRGQSAPLAAPQLASCASSGRAWWLLWWLLWWLHAAWLPGLEGRVRHDRGPSHCSPLTTHYSLHTRHATRHARTTRRGSRATRTRPLPLTFSSMAWGTTEAEAGRGIRPGRSMGDDWD